MRNTIPWPDCRYRKARSMHMNRVLHIKQQKCVTRTRCKHWEVALDAVQAKSWAHSGLLQFKYVVHSQPPKNATEWCQQSARLIVECFRRLSVGWGSGESGITEMCAGANYCARERPAKTRYSGHHFSRLRRGASQQDQTGCPAYYMRESWKVANRKAQAE